MHKNADKCKMCRILNVCASDDLKGKHFKILVTGEVFKATGNQQTKADENYIQLIRQYTVYGQPMLNYLLDSSLEETKEPLTPISYDPERLKNAIEKKSEDKIHKKIKVLTGEDVWLTGNYKELEEGNYLETINEKNQRRYYLEKDLKKI